MLKKKIFILFLCFSYGWGFTQSLQVDSIFHDADRKIPKNVYHFILKNGDTLKEGSSFYYYTNGKLWQSGFFHNHLMDSLWTTYFPTGAVKRKIIYKEGLRNSPFVNYYENGNLKHEGFYKDDSLVGEMKLYTQNGELWETRYYLHNKLNGMVTGYWSMLRPR